MRFTKKRRRSPPAARMRPTLNAPLRQTASRRPTRKDNYGRQGSINDQINKELYSPTCTSRSPTTMRRRASGYANYFEIQAQEERDHAMIFRNYLHENGEAGSFWPSTCPTRPSRTSWSRSEAAMEHEKYVTSLINDIYAAALEAHDYRAQSSSAGSSTSSWRKRTTLTP